LLVVVILIRPNLFPANWNNIGIKLEKIQGDFARYAASWLGQRYISFSSQLPGRTGQIKKPPATNN
tara:strand:- start:1231 stop:1428 length:198 start_codon:yes stop_codon:yes gene_type:complete